MQTPPVPAEEKERLEALEKLKILDTPREERFDRLVRLAARLLDVPITAISLVDKDRQWFKAAEGLSVRETSRDVSFCGHAILDDRPLVVEDTRQDPRFADNPLVTEAPDIRFYAGHPLRVNEHRIGTFCVIDRRPRKFGEEELALLGDLRALAERELQIDDINALRKKIDRANREKQKVEHELERFFSLPIDLLSVARPDGTFKCLSCAWPGTLGWSEQELLGQPFVNFVHPDDREATIRKTEHLSTGGNLVAFENRYRHRDGSYRWLLWNAIGSPRDDLIYASARDITELKRMQALKDEFVSTVSHELRTPLTSIRGSLDLLAAGIAGELPAEATSLIDVARNNAKRLSRLINDILDIEKIEAGKLEFQLESHPIVALVERALADNEQFASRRSVSFRLMETAAEVSLRIDADRVHQVLTNLLSNAAKFEPEGGSVEVAVRREADSVRISVSDHGPGIPADFQGRVFEKFAQADGSDRREKSGTGLGLSISKAIVERLGGKLGFTTEEGEGSTFYFELPYPTMKQPRFGAQEHRATEATAAGRPRILHVEDDPGIVTVTAQLLDDVAETVCAATIAEAKRSLEENDFDLVILDWRLPDGLASELLPAINLRGFPVLVFAAHDVPREAAAAVAEVLVKSQVSNDELRSRIVALANKEAAVV